MYFPHFDAAAFLCDYWQKKPLLIRNPWSAWRNPLEPDELAGLACEEDVESRLIVQKPKKGPKNWNVEHGPVPEARFGKLGKKPWTLLVQAVDTHVPDVAALIAPFRFIPNWRIDDVMVSYAADGGGVGPHYDHYDVFLVQGLGRRRWQVGALCDDATPLLPHDDLRLLADFEVTDEWILEPGDILYVPPRIAHNGIAVGDDCMTYSVGFRAPSHADLIEGWCDDLLAQVQEDDRYTDPDLALQDNPGEISASAIARLHAMVIQALGDRDAFARWFGRYNSARKDPETDFRPEQPVAVEQILTFIADGVTLSRNPASRFSFVRQQQGPVLLFVDGACFECAGGDAALAERLCAQDGILVDPTLTTSDAAIALLATLLDQGSVAFETHMRPI